MEAAENGRDGGLEAEAPAPSPKALVVGALGIASGDIGTSPLYAMRESFGHAGGLHPGEGEVLGVLSLVFWSLIVIVTLKYVWLILRADNRGEGGVLALSALAMRGLGRPGAARQTVFGLSIVGLGLFYGDGLITPAISVLSAVEGLETAQPALRPFVVPLAATVLVLLFVIQRHGTGVVGRLFGPVMIAWFLALAALGAVQLVQHPAVLRALSPTYAVGLFQIAGWQAFIAMGAIVLAVTGAEALYADMGHFGRRPIRRAWLGFVLPALLLNYFGQGALILQEPAAIEHPFYRLAPSFLLLPLILLATAATIIASQAVISGVFSLTRQAVQLGYLPRMTVRHTSAHEIGQVYLPRVNWLLMTGVLGLVLGFGSSSNLAAAYGISVTGAMGIDAILAGIVAATLWRWPIGLAVAVFGLFLAGDLAYVAANSLKIPEGGWLPLTIAGLASLLVVIWRRGRAVLWEHRYRDSLPLPTFIERLPATSQRVAGTAVFLTGNAAVVPHAMVHNLRHNKVVHERVVVMTVATDDVPYLPDHERVAVEHLGKGFFRVRARFGFMEDPLVLRALELCRRHGLDLDPDATSFFLGSETLIPSPKPELRPIEERIFMGLSATTVAATTYFGLPPDRVVELGTQIEI